MNFEIPSDLSRLLSKPKFTFKHLKKAVQEFHRKFVLALQLRLLTILWLFEGCTVSTSLRETYADLKPISIICLMRGMSLIEIDVISGLQLRVRNEYFIFLFLNQNICCWYSKEPSQ